MVGARALVASMMRISALGEGEAAYSQLPSNVIPVTFTPLSITPAAVGDFGSVRSNTTTPRLALATYSVCSRTKTWFHDSPLSGPRVATRVGARGLDTS